VIVVRELEQKIVKFVEERDWLQFNTPENLAKSISIEAGELLECFQWNNNYDVDEVKYEVADVMNYCILFCHQIGVDPKEIILEKMNISEKKYPIEKAKGVSTKYNKL
jgi:NTP pyrophosphatase (non-canonical NTP hydrolase)